MHFAFFCTPETKLKQPLPNLSIFCQTLHHIIPTVHHKSPITFSPKLPFGNNAQISVQKIITSPIVREPPERAHSPKPPLRKGRWPSHSWRGRRDRYRGASNKRQSLSLGLQPSQLPLHKGAYTLWVQGRKKLRPKPELFRYDLDKEEQAMRGAAGRRVP